MSALTDLFTAMANKIRSKTGTATTYTPSEMASDGIDDVYDAGVASATTPITPSNSSPASMTANTGYKPTANGYAIASYSSVTPSNVGDLVSSGDIVKFGGSGVVVDDIAGITPSDSNPVTLYMGHYYGMGDSGYAIASYSTATPSNSSPAYVESGKIYKMSDYGHVIFSYTNITPSSTPVTVYTDQMVHVGGSGVIVDSVPTPTSITPSNSSPVALTANTAVKPTASGYAISSYSSKTPSDTSPASVSSGAIIKASSSGYLYKTGLPILGQQPNVEFSNATAGTSGSVDITVAQKPRYIIMSIASRTSSYYHQLGVVDVTGAKAWRMGYSNDGSYSENWSNYTTYFPTISSSKVTYSYAAANYNKRVVIQIYY